MDLFGAEGGEHKSGAVQTTIGRSLTANQLSIGRQASNVSARSLGSVPPTT
jgi:hypothetical protein